MSRKLSLFVANSHVLFKEEKKIVLLTNTEESHYNLNPVNNLPARKEKKFKYTKYQQKFIFYTTMIYKLR